MLGRQLPPEGGRNAAQHPAARGRRAWAPGGRTAHGRTGADSRRRAPRRAPTAPRAPAPAGGEREVCAERRRLPRPRGCGRAPGAPSPNTRLVPPCRRGHPRGRDPPGGRTRHGVPGAGARVDDGGPAVDAAHHERMQRLKMERGRPRSHHGVAACLPGDRVRPVQPQVTGDPALLQCHHLPRPARAPPGAWVAHRSDPTRSALPSEQQGQIQASGHRSHHTEGQRPLTAMGERLRFVRGNQVVVGPLLIRCLRRGLRDALRALPRAGPPVHHTGPALIGAVALRAWRSPASASARTCGRRSRSWLWRASVTPSRRSFAERCSSTTRRAVSTAESAASGSPRPPRPPRLAIWRRAWRPGRWARRPESNLIRPGSRLSGPGDAQQGWASELTARRASVTT